MAYFRKIDLEGSDSAYVNVSGDTMTGTLTISENHALKLTGDLASIYFDDIYAPDGLGYKRITCNDGGGNFNIRAGAYYSDAYRYTTVNHGAVSIECMFEGVDGSIRLRAAPKGTNAGDPFTWATELIVDTSGVIVPSGNVGIGKTPNSLLDVNGAIATSIVTKTSNYTLMANDSTVLGDASAGAITFTLPAASSCPGRIYQIKKVDSSANSVTIDANGSETIDGQLTHSLTAQYEFVQIQSDGFNWYIIGG